MSYATLVQVGQCRCVHVHETVGVYFHVAMVIIKDRFRFLLSPVMKITVWHQGVVQYQYVKTTQLLYNFLHGNNVTCIELQLQDCTLIDMYN